MKCCPTLQWKNISLRTTILFNISYTSQSFYHTGTSLTFLQMSFFVKITKLDDSYFVFSSNVLQLEVFSYHAMSDSAVCTRWLQLYACHSYTATQSALWRPDSLAACLTSFCMYHKHMQIRPFAILML